MTEVEAFVVSSKAAGTVMDTYNPEVDLESMSESTSDTGSETSIMSKESVSIDSSAPSVGHTTIDPSCVVGMACRVPGATTPEQLWKNIASQVDLRKKMPSDRFNVDAWYHPDGTHKGTTNAKYLYPLDQDLGLFDAGFFRISGREAEAMDPQQRLLLEVVYEALENAGITLDEVRATQTSVFCGAFTNDYDAASTKDLIYYPKYTVTGIGNAILSNRISYFYDLHGPSVTIDTACSSSLVCFHLGNQSLLNGEAKISIVVGSALHYDPKTFVQMTDLGMLSTDGRCRHGDAQGSGYVRGEGITAVVLRGEKSARLAGNQIHATVRGTGVNHDGSKQGITLPSPRAQRDLIRRVYESAQLDPKDTGYVECHGTGTKAGDPRELQALSETISAGRDEPLHVGSVKTNIGHLEGASGLAGIIKATMALKHRQIPPNMHFKTPNPEIDFEAWKLQIPTQRLDWKSEMARRASINSFGYGGTNAHVILEEYEHPQEQTDGVAMPALYATITKNRPYLLPLTSHSERAGKIMASRFVEYLENHPDVSMADFVTTLGEKRTMHKTRSFAIGTDAKSMINTIENPVPVAKWTTKSDSTPRLGFVFTGQGAQWFAMGRQLIEQSPIFRQTLEKCDNILSQLSIKPDWSVVHELMKSKETSRLGETSLSQPICTALQLALVDLLNLWGIKPKAVVGHSSGEMAAAYAAGALTFENALVAAYYRGVHMGSGAVAADAVKGAMMAIGMSEAAAMAELRPYSGRITIGAMNSPTSFTVSGDEDAIVELQTKLSERKIFARRLQVGQAFHSHHMSPLAPAYQKALQDHPGFGTAKPRAQMTSSVTARKVEPDTMSPLYFATNMTSTVKFSDALTGIVLNEEDRQNVDVLVEIGPHPALKGPSKQTLDSLKLNLPYLASLDRSLPAFESLLSTAGQLFALGYPVSLSDVNSDAFINNLGHVVSTERPKRLSNLPTYGWDHERYWAETRVIKDQKLRSFNHEILGALVPGSLKLRPRFRNHLRVSEMPWLADHQIDGKVVFPAAGYINMAIEAASRLGDNSSDSIKQVCMKDICIKSALVVSEKDLGSEILLEIYPATESAKTTSAVWYEFVVFSVDETEQARDHCSGLISVERGDASPVHRLEPYSSPKEMQAMSDRCVSRDRYYALLEKLGLQYGNSFQLISGNLECGKGFATAPLTWQPSYFSQEENALSILHPAFLDASLHPAFAAIGSQRESGLHEPFVPTFVRSLKVSGILNDRKRQASSMDTYASVTTALNGPRVAINDIRIEDDANSELLVDIQGLELTSLGGDGGEDQHQRSLFFGTKWNPLFSCLDRFQHSLRIGGIAHLMDLYVHEYPNSTILHYSPCVLSTQNILSRLGGRSGARRRFAKLIVCPADNEATTQYEDLVTEYNGLVALAECPTGKFDAIVLSSSSAAGAYSEQLEDSGYLFMDTEDVVVEGLDLLTTSSNVGVWQRPRNPEMSASRPLTLLLPDKPSSQADALAQAIESNAGRDVVRSNFASLSEGNTIDGDAIVLASIGRNMFFENTDLTSIDFKSAQALLADTSSNLIWITQGGLMDCPCPEQALVSGLARSVRSENEALRLVLFDISDASNNIDTAFSALGFLSKSFREDEIAERQGVLYVPRVEADDSLNARLPNGVNHLPSLQPLHQRNRPLALRIPRPGLLETLSFSDDLEIMNEPLEDGDLEIEVKASAINFRDIAASMGIIDDYRLGDECAGIVTRKGKSVPDETFNIGDRVVAWRPGQGAHRTICRNPASLCYKLGAIPFSLAASLPCILTTALYSLIDTARLQRNETVLIHSAAGGVGQMAIQLAQMVGANIIATVGSPAKRELLKSTYGLAEHQILFSRDDTFVEGIMKLTNGRGVDVALNSLAGRLLHATWACLAPFGRLIEIGKRDIHQNSKIDMDPFRKNVSFSSVDLITIFEQNQRLGSRIFQESCDLVHDGKIRPPETVTEFSYAEAEKAFRLMQMGKVMGKIVLVPGEHDQVPVQTSNFSSTRLFASDKTYLVVGGLGGLGRSMSEWLFRKGAKSIVFLSRSGDQSAQAKETVRWLQTRGVRVDVMKGDVTDLDVVRSCVNQTSQTLAGVFHAAMVLQDAPLDRMSYKQWLTCVNPKVRGAWNLHTATADLSLDFFICFSSVSSILGGKGQTNYAAANSYLDALCRHRRSLGLPASTMNVGMITGIGAVSENAKLQSLMERIGYDGVDEEELFAQIETAVTCDQTSLAGASGFDDHQTITGINLRKSDLYWATKPLFRCLYANNDFSDNASQSAGTKSLTVRLLSANGAEKAEILLEAFVDKIAAILSVEKATIQPERGLADYGLDSIVAVEVRKWFSKSAQVELALFDVLGSKSIRDLVAKAVSMMPKGLSNPTDKMEDSKAAGPAVDSDKLEAKENDNTPDNAIEPTSRTEAPMSTYQKRLWFAHNMAEDVSFLNLPVILHVKGRPDVVLLKQTLEELKRRNDILRTSYFEGDESAQQMVMDGCEVHVPVLDFSSYSKAQSKLSEHLDRQQREALDIEEGEVMKASLFMLPDDRAALAFVFHHIAIDRGSSRSFLEQFTRIYDGLRTASNISVIPRPSVRYADFSVWHDGYLQSPAMQGHIDFWKDKYHNGAPVSKLLPFAKTERPETNDYKRQIHRDTLKASMHSRMRRISARLGITPAHFLMAAFRTFIYRYTEESDLTIHMIDGNRPHGAVNDTLGFFVNVIPIRCIMNEDVSFESMLRQTSANVLQALEHSSVPFDTIVHSIGTEKSSRTFPLGQIIVNYQMHGTIPTYTTQDFDIESVSGEDVPTACEMNLEALDEPSGELKLRLESSSTLYDSLSMERFLENFVVFLTSSIKDHRQPIEEINMVGKKELAHLKKHFFNMNTVSLPWGEQSAASKIKEMAREHPNRVALQTSDGETLTYQAIVRNAMAIASTLQKSGIKAKEMVAIYSRPGNMGICAMIGSLFARCGYVSLDPDFAADRLSFMVKDCATRAILVSDELRSSAGDFSVDMDAVKLISIESAASEVADSEVENAQAADADGDDPFYMIYTSGSTGRPKGVVLSVSNTSQMLSTLQKDYQFMSSDRFLHHSSTCFDLSVVQIFSALTAGARVCVASHSVRKDPLALASFMQSSGATVTYFTPTQFALLIEHAKPAIQGCDSYRIAYLAGERLPVRLVKAFYDLGTPAVLYNTWSPSELVVQTTIHGVEYPNDDTSSIPIGFPLANTRHYILDPKCQPLPRGSIGEIAVGGAQVGQGYLNRLEANKTSFVVDPFCSKSDYQRGWSRMFRTGDRGQFRPDGSLEFHGRVAGDKQVKLRGFRVDLGEVEQQLFVSANEDGTTPGLIDISVIARPIDSEEKPEVTDDRQVVAFVVPKKSLNDEAKRAFAVQLHKAGSQKLNNYMLPSGYQFVEALPTTIGGKVDRNKLLSCSLSLTLPTALFESANLPTNVGDNTVMEIIRLFKDVLKLPSSYTVNPSDRFFDLGGQSILMLRLQAKIKRILKKTIPLNAMFKTPTPLGIAGLLGDDTAPPNTLEPSNAGETIHWDQETKLGNGPRWMTPWGQPRLSRSDYRDILLTGVDSFVGIHMLEQLLRCSTRATVHVVGSLSTVTHEDILSSLHDYQLLTPTIKSTIQSRVICLPESIQSPHFGLGRTEFERLGRTIHAVYHLAGIVSLLQPYQDLQKSNVAPVHDLIELAALGQYKTEINYLSTWSVPHLQSWVTSKRKSPSTANTITAEVSADHFTPEPTGRYGYFKSRWVAEMLFQQAASRGFQVNIIRSSAVTAHSVTKVTEPQDDFIRRMVLSMVETGAIPEMRHSSAPFSIDFVPVNYLTETLFHLTTNDATKEQTSVSATPTIFHIGNPAPMPLSELSVLDSDGAETPAQVLPLERWLEVASKADSSPDATLRWAVLKDYLAIGHNMFALDRQNTRDALERVGLYDDDCEKISGDYLRAMLEKERDGPKSGDGQEELQG